MVVSIGVLNVIVERHSNFRREGQGNDHVDEQLDNHVGPVLGVPNVIALAGLFPRFHPVNMRLISQNAHDNKKQSGDKDEPEEPARNLGSPESNTSSSISENSKSYWTTLRPSPRRFKIKHTCSIRRNFLKLSFVVFPKD